MAIARVGKRSKSASGEGKGMPDGGKARASGAGNSVGNSVDRAIGARIRARRLGARMTQEAFAAKLGVTFQQIQKYEKGLNRIAASRLYDMACALKCEVADLFDGVASDTAGRPVRKQKPPALSDALDVPDVQDLIRHYAAIGSAKARKRVLALVRAMAMEEAAPRSPLAQPEADAE